MGTSILEKELYSGSNRRRSQRLSVPFRIEMKSLIGTVEFTEQSHLLNFGSTGVLFTSRNDLGVGTDLELKIYGPQSTLFHVLQGREPSGDGEVVFTTGGRVVRQEQGSSPGAPNRIAVEFSGPCRISKREAQ
jgi:hypothetical protein